MIAARVAGVPKPVSFIASESSFSSSVLPAVSMAVSRVASVNGFSRMFISGPFAPWLARIGWA